MAEIKQVQVGSLESSDCMVTIIQDNSIDNYNLDIKSSVSTQFHKSINDCATKLIEAYKLSNCKVIIEDKGALPFALNARLEAACNRFNS